MKLLVKKEFRNSKSLTAQLKGLAQRYGKSGACIPFCYNLQYFEANLEVPAPSSNYQYAGAVWPLLYPLKGRQAEIQRLRRMAKAKHAEYLSRWPAAATRNFLESVRLAVYHEWGVFVSVTPCGVCVLEEPIGVGSPFGKDQTIGKCLVRGFSTGDIQTTILARGRLWWRRAMKLLNRTL